MAVTAKYTSPIQVVETEQMRRRIKIIADREGISQAQVLREIHEYGIEWREAQSVQQSA